MARVRPKTIEPNTPDKRMSEKQRKRAAELCVQLPLIQHELFTLGLRITSAHMAKTIDKLGWELCVADIKSGRLTPDAKHSEEFTLKRDGATGLKKMRAQALRDAEKMLLGVG